MCVCVCMWVCGSACTVAFNTIEERKDAAWRKWVLPGCMEMNDSE